MSTILAVGFIEAEVRTFINLNYALGFVISLCVYALLGFKQTEKPYMHSVIVALCLWFIAAPVDFSINSYYGIPINPLIYLIPFILDVFGVSLGTMIGIRVREQRVTNAT